MKDEIRWPRGLRCLEALPMPVVPLTWTEMRKRFPDPEEHWVAAPEGHGIRVRDRFTFSGGCVPCPFSEATYEVTSVEPGRIGLKIVR